MNFGGTIRLNRLGVCIIIGACVLLVLYINTNSIENPKTDQGKNVEVVSLKKILIAAVDVAVKGGREVVAIRKSSDINAKSKGNTKEGVNEPVTKADYNSHCVMYYGLKHLFPKVKIVSEEDIKETDCTATSNLENSDVTLNPHPLDDQVVSVEDVTIWIDPLDATKEFTENLLQFVTTMVCVAVKGKPIIGVIHKPFEKEPQTFWAWSGKIFSDNLKHKKIGSNNNNNNNNNNTTRIIVSMSHTGPVQNISEQAFGKQVKVIFAAGAGYKALEVANGNVDAYIHMTDIKKWDICAGNSIIHALDGKMTTLTNDNLDYSSEKTVKNTKGLLSTMEKHEWYLEKLKPYLKA